VVDLPAKTGEIMEEGSRMRRRGVPVVWEGSYPDWTDPARGEGLRSFAI